jgi:ABC-type multidrug transport system fused ATPase/permease subunit
MKMSNINSIFQKNPVLFNDTLRINLDPFGEYSDIEIWSALDEVIKN